MNRGWTVVLSVVACARPLVPAPLADAGARDSGLDAGLGASDSGFDAGLGAQCDTGFDAGPPCVDDGGTCGAPKHASVCDIWKSPRSVPKVEYLILEATDEFVADDATYARALCDWNVLSSIDFGGPQISIAPSWLPSMAIAFDDAGFDAVSDGGYHDWDCLNQRYGAKVEGTWAAQRLAYVEIDRVIRVSDLFSDYASLPHVVSVGYEGFGGFTDCGYVNDTCLDIDAGVFTFLGYVEDGHCAQTGFRLVEQPSGARALDLSDGGIPMDWLDAHPACVGRLSR